MRGREGKGPPSADLLVCFPSRAHLTLMAPKPNVCSPSRPSESNSRHRRRHHQGQQQQAQHHHHMRNASLRGGSGGGGHASPLLWAKTKPNNDISEPTSPKVTCAGQIKVRNKPNSCKSWQSVMEEIERLHNNRNKKKKHHAWAEALGFKKDVMHFLTCLRNISFDFRCFGSFPSAVITSDDEDDEEEEEKEETYHTNIEKDSKEEIDESESSRTFSKWFMILQESNQSSDVMKREGKRGKTIRSYFDEEKFQGDDNDDDDNDDGPCAPPPPNALLLMRCRSAPAKSWLEDKEEEEKSESSSNDHEEKERNEEAEQRKTEETERLHVVMRCGTDFSKFSSDIAKETWVVGGMKDMLSRSRSSRR